MIIELKTLKIVNGSREMGIRLNHSFQVSNQNENEFKQLG